MITAIDTNILIDVVNEGEFSEDAITALSGAIAVGTAVVCDIVYAELCSAYERRESCDLLLDGLDVKVESLDRESAFLASQSWVKYLRSGGRRTRILPDFLIAGHAANHADQLLTRDRGFFRKYFPELRIVDPTKRLK
ncbi:MAG: type II toxin-antitoxin system VapC family toxin [Acidobacteriaceae bacterium]